MSPRHFGTVRVVGVDDDVDVAQLMPCVTCGRTEKRDPQRRELVAACANSGDGVLTFHHFRLVRGEWSGWDARDLTAQFMKPTSLRKKAPTKH